jgi:putative peptidoglycan lipid II flippase
MSLLKAVSTIGGYTLVSRVFGFVREVLMAAVLGAGAASDAFFVAFKLPNFLRRLFAEGAFNAAFIPLFAGTLEQEGREAAQRFAEEIFSVLTMILLTIVIVAEIFMPWVVLAFAPGFDADPAKFALAVNLSRICFPYILFISLLTLYSGILNSIHRFAAAAAAPIVLNICMIAALATCKALAFNEQAAVILSYSVTLAGLLQFIWMGWACYRADLLPRWRTPHFSAPVKRLLKLAIPAAFGASVAQVNLLIDLVLASTLSGAVSYLYYGDRLNELVIGVIGVAIGTALLPMLSRAIKAGDDALALTRLNQASFLCLALAIPAAVALCVLSEPLIFILFERGNFTMEDTAAVFPTLIAYSLGLPAFVMIKVIAPSFYAREDTKTPVKIGIYCVILNLIGNLVLIGVLQHVGLALSTTIAGWVNVIAMGVILHQRGHFLPDAALKKHCMQITLASILMGQMLWLVMNFLDWQGGTALHRLLCLGMMIATGMGVYFTTIGWLGTITAQDLKRLKRNKS